jgi:DNA-binding HxlR family transcriptional regulator
MLLLAFRFSSPYPFERTTDMAKSVDPMCKAFQTAIEVLGRPWTGLILGALSTGPLRFSEVSARTQGVGDKILSTRLKELETRGIVARQVDPGPPVKVVYRLTDRGRAFEQVMEAIERWGRDLIADDVKMRRRSG